MQCATNGAGKSASSDTQSTRLRGRGAIPQSPRKELRPRIAATRPSSRGLQRYNRESGQDAKEEDRNCRDGPEETTRIVRCRFSKLSRRSPGNNQKVR